MTERGRPTLYSEEIAAAICRELASGRTLKDICRAGGMPAEATVRLWAIEDREGFSARYAQAREIGYQSMADDLIEIADDGTNDWMERRGDDGGESYAINGEHVQRSKLRVDARKWLLSKALPKVYGDKITQEHSGPDGKPIEFAGLSEKDLARRIAFALAKGVKEQNDG